MANQLYTKKYLDKNNVFPKNKIENIIDEESGNSLKEILQGFNCYFLSYTDSVETTRLQVPKLLRKQGLWITYVDYENNTITEYYDNPSIEDFEFKNSSNWREGNNRLVGDLSISANGNWVINGIETEYKAKGETGETPLVRFYNKRFQVSYNKGNSWEYISEEFEVNMSISKYVNTIQELPNSASLGQIYAVGPIYLNEDTEQTNPYWDLYVYSYNKDNQLRWNYSGHFNSILVGIVNDLTTGGADKALSAEMGKTIYEIIGDWNSSNNESILDEIGEHYSEEGDSDYNKGLWGQMRNTRGRLSTLENQAIVKNDIVNNLTDGGPNKVLSAEMGKELYNKRIIVMTEEEFEHLQNPIEGSFYATYEE